MQAVKNGKNTVRVISDDTDVVDLYICICYWQNVPGGHNTPVRIVGLLIIWVWRLQMTAGMQLDRWRGAILKINESYSLLGAKSFQLLGMHALSSCDTVSYPFGHGKAMALKVLKSADTLASILSSMTRVLITNSC